MTRALKLGLATALVAAALTSLARAQENDGLADLDRATEVKLGATTLSDLDEVIRLTDSALKKGLDAGNTEFANAMLSATLAQRGAVRARLVLQLPLGDPRVEEFRKAALADLERAVTIEPKQTEIGRASCRERV